KGGAGAHVGGHAVLPQHDLLDLGGVGQHGQHHVAACANLRLGGGGGAGGNHFVHSCLIQITDQQVGVACFKQIFSHGLAHNAQTDQTDFHMQKPPIDNPLGRGALSAPLHCP